MQQAAGRCGRVVADRLRIGLGAAAGVTGTTRCPFSNCGTTVSSSSSRGRRSIDLHDPQIGHRGNEISVPYSRNRLNVPIRARSYSGVALPGDVVLDERADAVR
jgi:hypothetical protein